MIDVKKGVDVKKENPMEKEKVGNVLRKRLGMDINIPAMKKFVGEDKLSVINRFIMEHHIKQEDICGQRFTDSKGSPRFVPVVKCPYESYRDFMIYKKQCEICSSRTCRNGENCKILKLGLSPNPDFPLRKTFFMFIPHLAFTDATCMVRMAYYEREEILDTFPEDELNKIINRYESRYMESFEKWNFYRLRKIKSILYDYLSKKKKY